MSKLNTLGFNKRQLNRIIKEVENNLDKVLRNQVSKRMLKLMKEKLREDVYAVYSPTSYKRRLENGGLLADENIQFIPQANKLTYLVRNTATLNGNGEDFASGKSLAEIINDGLVDDTAFPVYMNPRPFFDNMLEDLEKNPIIENEIEQYFRF